VGRRNERKVDAPERRTFKSGHLPLWVRIGRVTRPTILVFDSGLGGLTVFRAIAAARPDAAYVYVADDAGFPYGPLPAAAVIARVGEIMADLVGRMRPDLVVIACNTASTLVLPPLRAAYPHLPFVGTVPAVKPAAERSRSRLISVLATPGTVARDYTRDLIAAHAAHCAVTLVGAPQLAPLAEAFMRDGVVDESIVAREIAPCFVESDDGRRTDSIVLACTHYPLLSNMFARLAPWPVAWIDPAPAIARRVESLLGERFPMLPTESPARGTAWFTSGATPGPALRAVLAGFGLSTETVRPARSASIR
jgi:glutamate racemase